MKKNLYNIEELLEIINFIARKEGKPMETLISETRKKIEGEKADISKITEHLLSLPEADRISVLKKFGLLSSGSTHSKKLSKAPLNHSGRISLRELSDLGVNELVNTKPTKIFINDKEFHVKSWTEASVAFVKCLVANGDLTKEHLPLCTSNRSKKAFVNSIDKQTHGNEDSGIFHKIADGFYVDIKYNAKYHILNMIRTLQQLMITEKYLIEIAFS